MRRTVLLTPILCLLLLAGCANLAPDYQRPDLPTPATVDGQAIAATSAEKLGWQQLITDERLRNTVQLALDNNRDQRIAALNIEKARAQYQIADAARYPALSGTASETSTSAADTITRKYSVGLAITSYEIDFFGRLNNLKDSALQSFLALESTQHSVRTSLVAEVSNAWLTLRSNQRLLELARDTLDSRIKTQEMKLMQQSAGSVSGLVVAQAQAETETARLDVARYTALVKQSRNALNLLAGTTVPDKLLPTTEGTVASDALALIDVPAGLSSEVLLHRPDIIAAEHTLQASYADIGAARAAFFPSITLTGNSGTASTSLDGLFDVGTRVWSFIPSINLPIFNAGKLNASLASAKAARDIQVATYEKAVQTAFREVADALADRGGLDGQLAAQKAVVDAYATSLRLSTERYRSGADSYMTVLDSQRSLYTAQKSLIALQLTEQSNRMTLFKVLGGEPVAN